ncbi:flagellin [Flavimaricola marinus]|uniref:Flagellar hook-associated protein FlgL n=1 Tax=Flavimaricola marinus TaxID=1819565 RepID=A0A238LFM4_9RHOB|nr:flagellin [Flavimaricola marinus]SMY08214.1 flagellar hook-associated protein FlgL [Flavimaricola marinus]
MAMNTLGDMAQLFTSSRTNYQIKSRLMTLSNELSTGRVEDLSAHLKGDAVQLADIDRRIAVGGAQLATADSVARRLSVMQATLERVDSLRSGLVESTGSMSLEPTQAQLQFGADAGTSAFESIVSAMNTQFVGQSLFAGATPDSPALAGADVMLAELRTAIAGATTAADASAAITAWFDTPGGGFETLGYLGDTGASPTRRIDDETTAQFVARADDQAVRDVLKASALAALATDTGLAMGSSERAAMFAEATTALVSASSGLVNLQASTGAEEARVESAKSRLTAQVSALSLMRNDMVSADPFETASELEQVQTQLETHYTVTARLSGLSLVGYL